MITPPSDHVNHTSTGFASNSAENARLCLFFAIP
jgi:hypothetical protein